jgi:hypothetical protein
VVRLVLLLGALSAVLALGGCGGSKHVSSSVSTPAPTVAGSSGQLSSSASATTSSAASTVTGSSAPSSTTSSPTTATAPSGGAGITTSPPAAGSANARVPATFAIGGGGALSPRTVSAPAFVAVAVSVASRDHRRHQVLIRTPTQYPLIVPAGGRATASLPGQKAGSYTILVDGSARGALLIGGQPGP